jgi:hypothetical protein
VCVCVCVCVCVGEGGRYQAQPVYFIVVKVWAYDPAIQLAPTSPQRMRSVRRSIESSDPHTPKKNKGGSPSQLKPQI